MKTEFRIDVLVGIQADAIPAANILKRPCDGVPFSRLYVRAKSKIAAELESRETTGNGVEAFGNIFTLRRRRLRRLNFRRRSRVCGRARNIQSVVEWLNLPLLYADDKPECRDPFN